MNVIKLKGVTAGDFVNLWYVLAKISASFSWPENILLISKGSNNCSFALASTLLCRYNSACCSHLSYSGCCGCLMVNAWSILNVNRASTSGEGKTEVMESKTPHRARNIPATSLFFSKIESAFSNNSLPLTGVAGVLHAPSQ